MQVSVNMLSDIHQNEYIDIYTIFEHSDIS